MAVLALALVGCDEPQPSPHFSTSEPVGAGSGAGGAMSAGGSSAGGHAGMSAGGTPAVQSRPLGMWILFGFEDPVSILLYAGPERATGEFDLTGTGCFDGPFDLIPGNRCTTTFNDSCTRLAGHGNGRHLEFGLEFGSYGAALYASNVYMAEDGSRMAGSFSSSRAGVEPNYRAGYGWARLDPLTAGSGCDLGIASSAVDTDILERASGTYQLQGDLAVGTLEPGVVYGQRHYRGSGLHAFVGPLGAFFNSDLSWQAETSTLRAGPVPATVPNMPVELLVHFDAAGSVSDIVATTSYGESGVLVPAPRQP